jgi:hypothetical protein
MNGAAERPGDAGRDPAARPGREPEHAEFAVARVGAQGRGRWSRLALAGFAAVLLGMIAVAIASRAPAPSSAGAAPTAPGAGGLAHLGSPLPPSAGTPTPLPTVLELRIPIVPVQTSDPASKEIHLEVQRQPNGMFVHGDVYVARVTWVFVSLRDPSGTITGWASVSVPGAAGPGVRGGPTMRFDVELAVPTGYAGPLTIQATAYDGTGRVVGATQLITPAAAAR